MTVQLRAELLKLRTTRTTAVLLLTAAGLTVLGAVLNGLSFKPAELATEDNQRLMFGQASNAALLALFAGVIAVTSEFRYGTIRPTLLFEPRRRRVLAAKLVAVALTGFAFAAVCVPLAFGAGLAVLALRDIDVVVSDAHILWLAFGTFGASMLTAMMGAGIGAFVRSQVGAIVGLAAYAMIVDALVFFALPSVGRFLPAQASNAFAGMPDEHLLSPAVGAAVAIVWTIVFTVGAIIRTDRSDV